jgi:hypothetical protein
LKEGDMNLKLNAPKQITWLVALVLGILGFLGAVITIPFLSNFAFWIVLIALVLLLLATYLEGL